MILISFSHENIIINNAIFSFLSMKAVCTLDSAVCNQDRDGFLRCIGNQVFEESIEICGGNLEGAVRRRPRYHRKNTQQTYNWMALRNVKIRNISVDLSSTEFSLTELELVTKFIQNNRYHLRHLKIVMHRALLQAVSQFDFLNCKRFTIAPSTCVWDSGERLTDDLLIKILRITNGLVALDVPVTTDLTYMAFQLLFQRFPKLHSLSIGAFNVVSQGIKYATHIKQIITVYVASFAELESIVQLAPNLVHLTIEQIFTEPVNSAELMHSALDRLVNNCGKKLRWFQITTKQVTDSVIATVALNCVNLTHINLNFSSISGRGLQLLARSCPKLAVVLCKSTKADDSGFKSLILQCNDLQVVDFSFCTNITDVSSHAAAKYCNKLIFVSFQGCNVSNRHTRRLLKGNRMLRNVSYQDNLGSSYGLLQDCFPTWDKQLHG